MKSRIIVPALLVSCGLAVSGCAMTWLTGQHGPFGTENLIERESFQKIDLAAVMTGGTMQLDGDDSRANQKKLEEAFKAFHELNDGNKQLLRNQVQERIMAASNQACAEYKRDMKKLDARSNMILGFLTTATAGAGAIFTPANTVRTLAGIAAILSGTRAEFNENYFQTLTVQLIVDGIESRRQEIYKAILKARKAKNNLIEYPVQRAISDAIEYHDNCSLVAGLQYAALSIQRDKDPGVKRLGEFAKDLKKSRAEFEKAVLTPEKVRVKDIEVELLEKTDAVAQADVRKTEAGKAVPKAKSDFGTAEKAIEKAMEADVAAKTALMVAQDELRLAKDPAKNTSKAELDRLTKKVNSATANEQKAAKKLAEEEAKRDAAKKILAAAKKAAEAFVNANAELEGVKSRLKVAKTLN